MPNIKWIWKSLQVPSAASAAHNRLNYILKSHWAFWGSRWRFSSSHYIGGTSSSRWPLYLNSRNSLVQVREHDLPQDCNPEPLLAFVTPMLADNACISMQIFFQSKSVLNQASEHFSETKDRNIHKSQFSMAQWITGSFLKTTAEDLNLENYQWDTTMVFFYKKCCTR